MMKTLRDAFSAYYFDASSYVRSRQASSPKEMETDCRCTALAIRS